jgi:hypothetical protein
MGCVDFASAYPTTFRTAPIPKDTKALEQEVGETTMRFMMLMIPGVYQGKGVDENFTPSADAVERMMKYNEELAKAGALVSLDGLTPPSAGARVTYAGSTPRVTDGPFPESKEVIGGYWIIRANSREEAIEWAKKVPADADDTVEVRQIFEWEEFPDDVKAKAVSEPVREAIGR